MKIMHDEGPVAKLRIQYLTMGDLLRRFLEAERADSQAMYPNTIRLMLPCFVVSIHILYAKVNHIYVQKIYSQLNKMTKVEFDRYAEGYFTIRCSNKFASGISSEMVIEQTANKKFKMVKGIIQRDFANGALSSCVLTKPALSLKTETIEDLSGIDFSYSQTTC